MSGRPRKQLPMSDEDIRREFLQAKDPKKQLKILADENCCSVGTILRIVNEKRKQETELSGFVPFQELVEKEAEKEKNGVEEYDFSPLPSAPPQAAADFDELGPSSLPDVQDLLGAPAAPRPYSPESGAAAQAAQLERSGETSSSGRDGLSRPENGEAPDAAGTEGGRVPHQSSAATASPGGSWESGNGHWVSGKDLSRMWHILGRLQGVLEASAAVGKPAEVMKGACDELEVLLMSLGENAPF